MTYGLSLCPNCFRTAVIPDPGTDPLAGLLCGRINITRTREGDAYTCAACAAVFDETIDVSFEEVLRLRAKCKLRKKGHLK